MKSISLEGQVAIVTGASRGIGRAIAEHLLHAGADVALNYNETPVTEIEALAASLGRKVLSVQADVSKTPECERLVDETLKALGRIDILVNNAGITRDTLLMRMDEEAWDAVLTTNLQIVYSCCKAAIRPMMKARSGAIVNVSSVSGIMGNAGQTNYSASKAGVIGFSKSLAREVASRGIRVNVVAPGFITSDMTNVLDEKVKNAVLGQVPLGKFGEPADIANAVLYLVSPMSAYMTGEVIKVDGGMAM